MQYWLSMNLVVHYWKLRKMRHIHHGVRPNSPYCFIRVLHRTNIYGRIFESVLSPDLSTHPLALSFASHNSKLSLRFLSPLSHINDYRTVDTEMCNFNFNGFGHAAKNCLNQLGTKTFRIYVIYNPFGTLVAPSGL